MCATATLAVRIFVDPGRTGLAEVTCSTFEGGNISFHYYKVYYFPFSSCSLKVYTIVEVRPCRSFMYTRSCRLLSAWFSGLLRFCLHEKLSIPCGAAGLVRLKQGGRHLKRAPCGVIGGWCLAGPLACRSLMPANCLSRTVHCCARR